MLMIVFGAGCLLLSVLFHAASLLHLGLPLLYALLVPTLFSGWYYSHYAPVSYTHLDIFMSSCFLFYGFIISSSRSLFCDFITYRR